MGPTDNRKPFEDWTFDDLKAAGVWSVISNISQGHQLSGAVHEILIMALKWQVEQQEKVDGRKK